MNSLYPVDVGGNYVICDFDNQTTYDQQVAEFVRAGAAGAIITSNFLLPVPMVEFNIPFVTVNHEDGELVKKYIIMNTKNPLVSV